MKNYSSIEATWLAQNGLKRYHFINYIGIKSSIILTPKQFSLWSSRRRAVNPSG